MNKITDTYKQKFAIGNNKMISYAQNGEDVVLERIFAGVKKGFYVDIGAADPIINSVTKHFYDKGWRGINVEPNKCFIDKYETERKRDTNINVGVAKAETELNFYFCPKIPEWSTFSKESIMEHIEHGYNFIEKRIKVIPLERLFVENKIKQIDFLKIDTEGYEQEVLEGNNWQKYRPIVVIVESQSEHSWEEILLQNDYLFTLYDGLNRFYLRNESQDLFEQATIPANIRDMYDPYRYSIMVEEQVKTVKMKSDKEITQLHNELVVMKNELNRIKSAKTYKIWRKYCQIRDKFRKGGKNL